MQRFGNRKSFGLDQELGRQRLDAVLRDYPSWMARLIKRQVLVTTSASSHPEAEGPVEQGKLVVPGGAAEPEPQPNSKSEQVVVAAAGVDGISRVRLYLSRLRSCILIHNKSWIETASGATRRGATSGAAPASKATYSCWDVAFLPDTKDRFVEPTTGEAFPSIEEKHGGFEVHGAFIAGCLEELGYRTVMRHKKDELVIRDPVTRVPHLRGKTSAIANKRSTNISFGQEREEQEESGAQVASTTPSNLSKLDAEDTTALLVDNEIRLRKIEFSWTTTTTANREGASKKDSEHDPIQEKDWRDPPRTAEFALTGMKLAKHYALFSGSRFLFSAVCRTSGEEERGTMMKSVSSQDCEDRDVDTVTCEVECVDSAGRLCLVAELEFHRHDDITATTARSKRGAAGMKHRAKL
mmetsp:Transcript_4321/g.10544  ORF Transcript_4321/g.10544 Transcript_4321/m.10544 type:complete len:410 (+) Transcript_4321:169-1398(+)|eukprot:CAMPEP_0178995772 /NCGR_PEP_ID=MMETSP0795-20121207/7995_1 /TAXON_ID=88552 /ORGANISM="Amoebophrya sp., Strain Ameob2" /LENGTH=409 /DNA_ID=CAMNT_0020688081 /DNA_START=103 /DNA_END=1332 /DNA_ORIENTATION=-